MNNFNNYNSQWVSFHIRDHLEDGEISVHHTVIEGYIPPQVTGVCHLYVY
jgi:hypothetical protein